MPTAAAPDLAQAPVHTEKLIRRWFRFWPVQAILSQRLVQKIQVRSARLEWRICTTSIIGLSVAANYASPRRRGDRI